MRECLRASLGRHGLSVLVLKAGDASAISLQVIAEGVHDDVR